MNMIAFVSVLISLFSSSQLRACSCQQLSLATFKFNKEVLLTSQNIFVGKVVQNKLFKNSQKSVHIGIENVVTKFKIIKSFKGTLKQNKLFSIKHSARGEFCGIHFKKDLSYLIYTKKDNSLGTSLCSLIIVNKNAFKKLPIYKQLVNLERK